MYIRMIEIILNECYIFDKWDGDWKRYNIERLFYVMCYGQKIDLSIYLPINLFVTDKLHVVNKVIW